MDERIELDWHINFQDEDYLNLSRKRLESETKPLDWCEQFAELINSAVQGSACALKLHDIGCNVGHFCRVLDCLGTKIEYRGFDISETYLAIAKASFPALDFQFLDIERTQPTELADVSVISATLEHIEGWQSALSNILASSRRLVLLRSLFGDASLAEQYRKPGAARPYLIRQFTFREVAELAAGSGFATKFRRDRATDSIPQYLGCELTRTQYIAVMTRR